MATHQRRSQPNPVSLDVARRRSAAAKAGEPEPASLHALALPFRHGDADPALPATPRRRALDAASVIALQRSHGNAYVQRFLVKSPGLFIARIPEKKQAAAGKSPFDGVLLGANRDKKEVRVKREVGGIQGYDDRLQAIAVARLAQAEPAVVVLGKDGKWHAFETTAGFAAGPVSAPESAASGQGLVTEMHGVPSRTGIAQAIRRVEKLKIWMAKLDEWEQHFQRNKPMLGAIKEKQSEAIQELAQANQTRAALILGVPESDIHFSPFTSGRQSGRVNIVGTPGKGSAGGAHGRVGGEGGFKEGAPSAFHIDSPELDDPTGAQAVLFHEVQHKRDYDFAQHWISEYKKTGAIYVSGQEGRAPFETWLNKQVKDKRLTKADVELIISESFDDTAGTEARANVRTFLAALQAGDPALASKLLVAYAHALKPKKEGGGGQYATPPTGSYVLAALVDELKTAYKQMPEPMKRQYEAAVAAAKTEYPAAWLSALDFSKRKRK